MRSRIEVEGRVCGDLRMWRERVLLGTCRAGYGELKRFMMP